MQDAAYTNYERQLQRQPNLGLLIPDALAAVRVTDLLILANVVDVFVSSRRSAPAVLTAISARVDPYAFDRDRSALVVPATYADLAAYAGYTATTARRCVDDLSTYGTPWDRPFLSIDGPRTYSPTPGTRCTIPPNAVPIRLHLPDPDRFYVLLCGGGCDEAPHVLRYCLNWLRERAELDAGRHVQAVHGGRDRS